MSHKLGEPLDVSAYLSIFLFIFSLIMAIYLFRMYKRTNLKDYLYIDLAYFFLFLNMPVFLIRHRSEPSIFLWVLNLTLLNLTYFTLLLHFMMIRNDKISKNMIFGVASFLVLQFILKLFATIQLIPARANYLGIWIYVRAGEVGLMAPALKFGDIYIIADGMMITDNYYRSILLLYGLITYIKIQPAMANSKTKTAKRAWIITVIFWIIAPFSALLGSHFNNPVASWALLSVLGGVVSVFLLGFIIIMYPYSLILTKEQIVRAKDLYKFAETEHTDRSRTLNRISNYLESLPPDLKQLLKSN